MVDEFTSDLSVKSRESSLEISISVVNWIEYKKKTIKNDEHFATEFMRTNEREPLRDERRYWNNENNNKKTKKKYMTRCECWNNFNGIYREVNSKIPAGNSNTMKLYISCCQITSNIGFWLVFGANFRASVSHFSACFSILPKLDTRHSWHVTEYGFQ